MKTLHHRLTHLLVTLLGGWLLLVACVLSVQAQSAKPVPQLTGRVIDLAGMVTAEWKPKLIAQLEAHEQKTGNQVVVLTIPSLKGEALEDYSLRVARTWGLGQKDRNNGVLFLIAKGDRKMRIEVGYGVEGTLTDAIASFIIRQTVRPLFKQGLMNGGIIAGTGQIIEVLEADEALLQQWKKRSKKRKRKGDEPQWQIFFFVAIWAMIFFGGFVSSALVRMFGKEIKPGHYRWLGMDAGPNAPKPKRRKNSRGGYVGGGWSGGSGGGFGGGGFSGGGGGFGGGGSSGGW